LSTGRPAASTCHLSQWAASLQTLHERPIGTHRCNPAAPSVRLFELLRVDRKTSNGGLPDAAAFFAPAAAAAAALSELKGLVMKGLDNARLNLQRGACAPGVVEAAGVAAITPFIAGLAVECPPCLPFAIAGGEEFLQAAVKDYRQRYCP